MVIQGWLDKTNIMQSWPKIFCAAVTLLSLGCAISLEKIRVKDNHLVDEFGRIRMFHGMNSVNKGFPWYPSDLLNETNIALLAQWGFNVVRLGAMWSGVEVAPFVSNQTYILILDTIVGNLNKYGIYALLDMHQDGLSSDFGLYDGVPLWLIRSFPPAKNPYPFPFKTITNWNENVLTEACGMAWEHIYSNACRALDHLGWFWQTIAESFGNKEGVLGYEIINEPFPGYAFGNPELFLPALAGRKVLQPFYSTVSKFIRAVDNTTLIFYEPVTWGMIFNGKWLGSGFTEVPGGDDYRDRSVLSFHYYCWFIRNNTADPYNLLTRILCDAIFFPQVLRAVQGDLNITGGAAFLTEFGECEANRDHNSTEYLECSSILNEVDQAFVSWTYWDSNFFNPDGSVVRKNVKLFSRTYAMAIAGGPVSTSFNHITGEYWLYYRADALVVPTIVFVSPYHYEQGFDVKTSAGVFAIITDPTHVSVFKNESFPSVEPDWVHIIAHQ